MNYDDLISAIAAYMTRTDLGPQIPTFIKLTEARINREVRVRQMECRATATISGQFSTLPDNFLQMRNIQVNTNPVTPLQYVTPQRADVIRQGSLQGDPQFFSVVGNRLELIPIPQQAYTVEMTYYERVPSISPTQTSNWLLTDHPDIYLNGCLVQACLVTQEDPTTYATLYDTAMQELMLQDERAQFQGTTPIQRGRTIG